VGEGVDKGKATSSSGGKRRVPPELGGKKKAPLKLRQGEREKRELLSDGLRIPKKKEITGKKGRGWLDDTSGQKGADGS